MAVYYLDTSALVKRYVLEQGTVWIQHLTDRAATHDLYMVLLTGPEMIAALFRKARTGQIALADATQATAIFRLDWRQQYRIMEASVLITESAMLLVERYTLRGFDAMHLAAALEVQATQRTLHLPALTFVSADNEQIKAAQAEGLLTENPNNYR
ncbi:MAG: type II toxin-antitoxin system VapC family toxin [Chloroflexota bacterium]|nr:type II toxin-antitoxin system VapC family toxin [Chloroflexota bacterium]